jgi:hypothetical protein
MTALKIGALVLVRAQLGFGPRAFSAKVSYWQPGADICRVARDLQNCAAQADVIADFRLLQATPNPEGRLGGTNRLRRDLARNIAAYPAFLPILLSLQEGLFFSLYLARFSRNQR